MRGTGNAATGPTRSEVTPAAGRQGSKTINTRLVPATGPTRSEVTPSAGRQGSETVDTRLVPATGPTRSEVTPAAGRQGSKTVDTRLVQCAHRSVLPRPARFQFRMGVGEEGGHKTGPRDFSDSTPLSLSPLPFPESPLPPG